MKEPASRPTPSGRFVVPGRLAESTVVQALALEQRVAAVVDQHRAQLVALVDQALDQALAELVAERLHARNGNGNGNGGPAAPDAPPASSIDDAHTPPAEPAESPNGSPAPRLCRTCGEREAAPDRLVCYSCRERERRERKAASTGGPAGDGPRAGAAG